MPSAIELLSQGVNGAVLGLLLSVVALGFTLVLGVMGVINFAHGSFFAIGAYVAYSITRTLGFWPSLVISPAVAAVVGMFLERTMIRKTYGKDPMYCLLLTFGVAMSVEELVCIIWGRLGHSIAAPAFASGYIDLGFMMYSKYRLFLALLSMVAIVVTWFFLERTPYGNTIKAGASDSEMVAALGKNLPRLRTAVFGIGSALAGLAGVIAGPLWSVRPSMGNDAMMPAMVIVILGGLGSFWGSVIGGLLVGLCTSLAVTFIPRLSDLVMYILAAVVLLRWPRGIMGEKSILE